MEIQILIDDQIVMNFFYELDESEQAEELMEKLQTSFSFNQLPIDGDNSKKEIRLLGYDGGVLDHCISQPSR